MDDFGGVENRLLTDSEKEEFRVFEQMFQTEGWAKLQTEMMEEVKEAPARLFWEAKSFEEIQIERARLGNLMRLIHFEAVMEQRKEGLVRDRLSQIDEVTQGYGAGE